MKSSREKQFIAWLKQNAFKRDVTGLIKQRHRGKNLDQIIEIELGDEDLQDEIEIWRDNYYQVTAWYQLEYFFDRSYEDLSDSWFVGETVTTLESDGYKYLVWGIKSDLHLDLKLREWVERFDDGEVKLVDVFDEIPQRFGGDLEGDGRYKSKDGEWVKFRYNSEREEIIEKDETTPPEINKEEQGDPDLKGFISKLFNEEEKEQRNTVDTDKLNKERAEKELLDHWNLKRSKKKDWLLPIIYSVGFCIILSLVVAVIFNFVISQQNQKKSPRQTINPIIKTSYDSDKDLKLQKIRDKHADLALERSRKSIPTTKEDLLSNIREIEENSHHLPKEYKKFMSLQLEARKRMVELTFKNKQLNIEIDEISKEFPLLDAFKLNLLVSKVTEKMNMSQDIYEYQQQLNVWVKSEVIDQDLDIAQKDIDKLDQALYFQREFNRVESNFFSAVKELSLFLIKTPYEFSGEQFLFDSNIEANTFNRLMERLEAKKNEYLSFDFRLLKRN